MNKSKSYLNFYIVLFFFTTLTIQLEAMFAPLVRAGTFQTEVRPVHTSANLRVLSDRRYPEYTYTRPDQHITRLKNLKEEQLSLKKDVMDLHAFYNNRQFPVVTTLSGVSLSLLTAFVTFNPFFLLGIPPSFYLHRVAVAPKYLQLFLIKRRMMNMQREKVWELNKFLEKNALQESNFKHVKKNRELLIELSSHPDFDFE